MRRLILLLVVLGGCGGKETARASVGGYTMSLPEGWVQMAGYHPDGQIELHRPSSDPHGDMSVVAMTGPIDFDTGSESDCKTGAAQQSAEIRSVAVVDLPVGKACRIVGAHDGQINEQLVVGGDHGLIVDCMHDEGGGAVADCDAIFRSLTRAH